MRLVEELASWSRFAVIAAHPDDEVIGCSALLRRYADRCTVIHLTDGAPRRPPRAPYPTRELYARARREEALAALAIAGVPEDRCLSLGVVDQEAALDLVGLSDRLRALLDARGIDVVLTHPFEGGHPDHDAAAFVVRAVARERERRGEAPLTTLELTSYHLREGQIVRFEFLPGGDEGEVIHLDAEERAAKQRMYDCHLSQRHVLSSFPIGVERLRRAPRHDFTRPPHEGTLCYESLSLGMTAARWIELASAAERELRARASEPDGVAERNKRYWDLPEVAEEYAHKRGPTPGEAAILAHFNRAIQGKRLLDIAVGAGRTTEFLRPLAASYIGVDYSEEMLSRCRARFPGADLRLCDVRSLHVFQTGAFDVVVCSANALDDVDATERAAALREMERLLAAGGLLVFSAHHLAAAGRSRFVRERPSVEGAGHAIVEEVHRGFVLPTYYVLPEVQIEQLRGLGFVDVRALDQAGGFLDPGAPCEDGWLHYVARKGP